VRVLCQGRVGQVFMMKRNIMGQKKAGTEPHAVKDPITGELLVANEDIKKATLKYCAANLQNKNQDPEVEPIVNLQKACIVEKLKEVPSEPLVIDKADFDFVVKKFKFKETKSYDFLLKSSEEYQKVIFKLCRKMIMEEDFPDMFRKTILYIIWKGKGPQEIMKNSRFIHMKEHYLPRTVESIVVNVMKDDILDKSTMYQVGGQPGHSTDEHLFAIRSLMELLEARGQGMVFTLVNLVAFFDREDLYDAMATLYQTGVNSDAIRSVMVQTKSEYTD
jgi:hypothetical protein